MVVYTLEQEKVHFDLDCGIWGTENPNAYIEKLTHPKGVTVWC